MKKIQFIGSKIGDIKKQIQDHMKEKGLNNEYSSFRELMGLYDDDIVKEAHSVVVYIHPGSNEGYFIEIGTLSAWNFAGYFIMRLHTSLDEAIKVQNELIKVLI